MEKDFFRQKDVIETYLSQFSDLSMSLKDLNKSCELMDLSRRQFVQIVVSKYLESKGIEYRDAIISSMQDLVDRATGDIESEVDTLDFRVGMGYVDCIVDSVYKTFFDSSANINEVFRDYCGQGLNTIADLRLFLGGYVRPPFFRDNGLLITSLGSYGEIYPVDFYQALAQQKDDSERFSDWDNLIFSKFVQYFSNYACQEIDLTKEIAMFEFYSDRVLYAYSVKDISDEQMKVNLKDLGLKFKDVVYICS